MVGFPRTPITQRVSVDTYNKFTEGQNVPRIDKSILRHTVGQPLTYPTKNTGMSNVPESGRSEYSTNYIGVGTGAGGTSQNIGVDITHSETIGFSQEYDFELVATAGVVKIGGGYGFDKSKKSTTTVGKSTSVEGYVPSLVVDRPSNINTFEWSLMWYNYIKSNQKFQVVNYSVK